MADRMRTAALAGALVVAGCVAAAWFLFQLLSAALCPTDPSIWVTEGCVPAGFFPWYALAAWMAFVVVGFVMVGIGVILYRRARAGDL